MLTEEQCGDIVTAYVEGATIDQLAEIYETSITPIRRALFDAGVTLRPTGARWPYDEATEKRLAWEYEWGATIRELVKQYGGSDKTIRKAIVKQGGSIRPTGPTKRR